MVTVLPAKILLFIQLRKFFSTKSIYRHFCTIVTQSRYPHFANSTLQNKEKIIRIMQKVVLGIA